MAWQLQCGSTTCGRKTCVREIVSLISTYTDTEGWLRCPCGHRAYIAKSFTLQEPGRKWEPYLRGIVRLGVNGDTYQPFVFLVSHEAPDGPISHAWFTYYKDCRPQGKLKFGHGPGGPPIVPIGAVRQLVQRFDHLGFGGPAV